MFNCTESTLPIRPQAQSADTFPGSWLKRYSRKTNKEFSGMMPQKISRRNRLAGCTFGMETFRLWFRSGLRVTLLRVHCPFLHSHQRHRSCFCVLVQGSVACRVGIFKPAANINNVQQPSAFPPKPVVLSPPEKLPQLSSASVCRSRCKPSHSSQLAGYVSNVCPSKEVSGWRKSPKP